MGHVHFFNFSKVWSANTRLNRRATMSQSDPIDLLESSCLSSDQEDEHDLLSVVVQSRVEFARQAQIAAHVLPRSSSLASAVSGGGVASAAASATAASGRYKTLVPWNQPLYDHFRKLGQQASDKNPADKRVFVYKKAARSVQACQSEIRTRQDCLALRGIGSKLASQMQRVLNDMMGVSASLDDVPTISPVASRTKPAVLAAAARLSAAPIRASSKSDPKPHRRRAHAAALPEASAAAAPVIAASNRPEKRSRASSDAATSTTAFHGVNNGDWKLVLLQDAREVGADKQRHYFTNLFSGVVELDVRGLPLGDFVWVLKRGEEEVVQDVIIERKTVNDLATSIKDGARVRAGRRRTHAHPAQEGTRSRSGGCAPADCGAWCTWWRATAGRRAGCPPR
jgi:hypothetical protein